jgi:hypothetical protein
MWEEEAVGHRAERDLRNEGNYELLVDVVPQGALKIGKLLKPRTEENYETEPMSRLPAKFRPRIPAMCARWLACPLSEFE